MPGAPAQFIDVTHRLLEGSPAALLTMTFGFGALVLLLLAIQTGGQR